MVQSALEKNALPVAVRVALVAMIVAVSWPFLISIPGVAASVCDALGGGFRNSLAFWMTFLQDGLVILGCVLLLRGRRLYWLAVTAAVLTCLSWFWFSINAHHPPRRIVMETTISLVVGGLCLVVLRKPDVWPDFKSQFDPLGFLGALILPNLPRHQIEPTPRNVTRACLLTVLGLSIAAIALGAIMGNPCEGIVSPPQKPGQTTSAPVAPTNSGSSKRPVQTVVVTTRKVMTVDDARRSVVKLSGKWREAGYIFDDEGAWTASGVVVARTDNRLRIATNSHCLGLGDLSRRFRLTAPDIREYEIKVQLLDGAWRPAERMAETPRHGLDLALIEIDATFLIAGREYEVAPLDQWGDLKVGDDLVAVGAPLGLSDTVTYGRVSAKRVLDSSSMDIKDYHSVGNPPKTEYMLIQTDTQFTHGNSGGGLFVSRGNTVALVGLPTFVRGEGGQVRFAVAADELSRSESTWQWFAADPRGATKALAHIYDTR